MIDAPLPLLPSIEKVLATATMPLHITWAPADTSLASTKPFPRTTIQGYLSNDNHSDLTATLCCRHLRSVLPGQDVYVGRHDAYLDSSSLMVELTHWAALATVKQWCDDIVPLSPHLALIKTQAPPGIWQETLTEIMLQDPARCITKIKWRKSMHGGRPWATPAATAVQLQAIKAQAPTKLQGKHLGIGRDLESEVSIHGTPGPDPTSLMQRIMESVSRTMGCILQQKTKEKS